MENNQTYMTELQNDPEALHALIEQILQTEDAVSRLEKLLQKVINTPDVRKRRNMFFHSGKEEDQEDAGLIDFLYTTHRLMVLIGSYLRRTESIRSREQEKQTDTVFVNAVIETAAILSEISSVADKLRFEDVEDLLEDRLLLVEWYTLKHELHIAGYYLKKTRNQVMKADSDEKLLLSIPVETALGRKHISVVQGDLCATSAEYDVVICSAYKNSYYPSYGTLIGEMYYKKEISVQKLSEDCELDLRERGAWLSKLLDSNFHRIACVELLDLNHRENADIVCLKSIFSTMNYVLQQASFSGIPLRKAALPLLGTGSQNLDVGYIAGPLATYCVKALEDIDELEEIVFFENDPEKAEVLANLLQELLKPERKGFDVFISYSSKQQDEAMSVYNKLMQEGITCWMAPQSIPIGSQYYLEISKAIHDIKILVLVLTDDAVKSVYVPKEVSASMGARKRVMPFQLGEVELKNGFDFLLTDVQITHEESEGHLNLDTLTRLVRTELQKLNAAEA